MFKNSHRPNDSRQTCLKTSLYFSVCYKSRGLGFLHLCKCPDSIHLGFVFTVSLQDQGQFLLLHQEPGQEGEQHRSSAAPARPPCPNPALFSTGPPLPTLLKIFVDSVRDHHSPATLIPVSRVGNEPWTTMGFGQGCSGYTLSSWGDLGP